MRLGIIMLLRRIRLTMPARITTAPHAAAYATTFFLASRPEGSRQGVRGWQQANIFRQMCAAASILTIFATLIEWENAAARERVLQASCGRSASCVLHLHYLCCFIFIFFFFVGRLPLFVLHFYRCAAAAAYRVAANDCEQRTNGPPGHRAFNTLLTNAHLG